MVACWNVSRFQRVAVPLFISKTEHHTNVLRDATCEWLLQSVTPAQLCSPRFANGFHQAAINPDAEHVCWRVHWAGVLPWRATSVESLASFGSSLDTRCECGGMSMEKK